MKPVTTQNKVFVHALLPSLLADPDCYGSLESTIRGEQVTLVCNECGHEVLRVPCTELERFLARLNPVEDCEAPPKAAESPRKFELPGTPCERSAFKEWLLIFFGMGAYHPAAAVHRVYPPTARTHPPSDPGDGLK